MKPLYSIVVAILVIAANAHPENIEEVKELPQSKEPVVEAEASEPQARSERCTACSGSHSLKSTNDVLAAIKSLPNAEIHTQESFEGCSSAKGCAGLKVKDGKVVEKFGNLQAFQAAANADRGNEFQFQAAANSVFEGAVPNGGPFWWMNKDSPFKAGAAGGEAFEKISKTSSSYTSSSNGAGGVDLAANPFLNGDFSKIAGAGFGGAGANFGGAGANFGGAGGNFAETKFSESSSSTTKEIDISGNPFLNGGVQGAGFGGQNAFGSQSSFGSNSQSAFEAGSQGGFGNAAGLGGAQGGFGAQGNQAAFGAGRGSQSSFGAGQASQNAFGASQGSQSAFGSAQGSQNAFNSGSKYAGNGYTGSSPSPFAAPTGANVNLIQNTQKGEYDFEQQQQTQQNIDEAFQSTGNVQSQGFSGGDLQQTCAGQGYVCVHKSQCNNGVVNTNGGGLLQANTQKQYCNTRTEICCRIETQNLAGAGTLQSSLGVGSGTFQGSASNQAGLFSQSGQSSQGSQSNFGAGFGTGQSTAFGAGQSTNSGFNAVNRGTTGFAAQGNTNQFGAGSTYGTNKFGSTASGYGSTVAPTPGRFGSTAGFNNEVFKSTSQSNFIETDSFSSGSENAGVFRPGTGGAGLKPGIPYLPPLDASTSGSNVVSTGYPPAFVTTPRPFTTPRPVTTPRPTYLPPPPVSTKAPEYLPPVDGITGSDSFPQPTYIDGQLILDETLPPRVRPQQPQPPRNNEIPSGCAAALKCTPIEFCTAEGVISNTTVVLTREQDAYRVPLTDCKDLATGRVGKCCRDPLYTDPWPTNQLGKWVPGVFGGNDGKYVPDSRVSSNNQPGVTVRPPVTGSVYLNNFRTTTKPTVTQGFPSTTVSPGSFIQKNQYGQGSVTTVGRGGQGSVTQGGRGQVTLQGQGFGGQYGEGSSYSQTTGGLGVVGQGSQVTTGQGFGIRGGGGQIVTQGTGQTVSQGAGEIVRQGQGFGVSQGTGQIVTQGFGVRREQGSGATQEQGFGIQGSGGQGFGISQGGGIGVIQGGGGSISRGGGIGVIQGGGSSISRGGGVGITQGGGIGVSRGEGFAVTQGGGQYGTQGQGTIVSQGQGSLISRGQGTGVTTGTGFGISQGQGFGVTQGGGFTTNQGNGFGVSQGQGQGFRQGVGFGVSQGQGQAVIRGQGQTLLQGQGQKLILGQGEEIRQGFGTGVSQGQGFYVSQNGEENEFSESVQRVYLPRYTGSGDCGVPNPQKPFGNRKDLEVDFAEIPWQAMVLLQTNRSLLCGGVITRPDVVLTSASCVEGLEAKNVLIKGGEWKLGIDEEPLPFQIVQVKHILRHPFYKAGIFRYDAAILVLTENLRLAKNIWPICLPSSKDSLDAFYNGAGECIVTGWGKSVLQANILGSVMHSENVSLLNPGDCEAKINQDYPHLLEHYDQDSCICGQPTNPANNICKVDIGSALACTTGDNHFVLQGIFSWDSGCQVGNQLASFYRLDLEWYEWAIGLIESVRFSRFTTTQITNNKIIAQTSGVKSTYGSGIKGSAAIKEQVTPGTSVITGQGFGVKGFGVGQTQTGSAITGQGFGVKGFGVGQTQTGSTITGQGIIKGYGVGTKTQTGTITGQGFGVKGFGVGQTQTGSAITGQGVIKGYGVGTKTQTGTITGQGFGVKGFGVGQTQTGSTITGQGIVKGFGVGSKTQTGSISGQGIGIKGFGLEGQTQSGEYSQFGTTKFGTGTTKFSESGEFGGEINGPISNTFSATYTEKKFYQSEPKIVTYTTKPEIVTFTTKPEYFTYTTKPKIFTYTTKPEIVTYTTKPEIVTYTTNPEIITYTTKPKIVTYTTKPQIVRFDYQTSGSQTSAQIVPPSVSFNPSFSEVVGSKHVHDAKCKCLENGKK